MSSPTERSVTAERRGPVRSPQSLVGGLALLALAALAFYLTRDLTQGTLRAMGPAMLPRWLAVAVGLCGLALIAGGFTKAGDAFERSGLRGPVFVVLGILAFAVTIRPFSFGGLSTPGLGLVAAGPLAIFIGGYATPEARLRDLAVLSLALTAVCMVLFGDLLNLPIPVFPQSFADLFPAGWSQKAILRATAAGMALLALVVFVATRSRRANPAVVEVPDHSGRI